MASTEIYESHSGGLWVARYKHYSKPEHMLDSEKMTKSYV